MLTQVVECVGSGCRVYLGMCARMFLSNISSKLRGTPTVNIPWYAGNPFTIPLLVLVAIVT